MKIYSLLTRCTTVTNDYRELLLNTMRGYGAYCSAINCHNCRGKNKEKSFFKFPLDVERCMKWLINTRRADLMDKDLYYLRTNCLICCDHFEEQCFANLQKNRLKPDAVPSIFDFSIRTKRTAGQRKKLKKHVKREPGKTTPTPSEQVAMQEHASLDGSSEASTSSTLPSSSTEATVQESTTDNENYVLSSSESQETRLRGPMPCLPVRTASSKLKKEDKNVGMISLTQEQIIEASKKYLARTAHEFFALQMRASSCKEHRYSKPLQKLLLNLYSQSPEAYRLLTSVFNLPLESVLSQWSRN